MSAILDVRAVSRSPVGNRPRCWGSCIAILRVKTGICHDANFSVAGGTECCRYHDANFVVTGSTGGCRNHETNFIVTGGTGGCHYWRHRRLSWWQSPVPPVTTKLTSCNCRFAGQLRAIFWTSHWDHNEITAFLQTFSHGYSWIKMIMFWFIYHSSSFPRAWSIINNRCFWSRLAYMRQQASRYSNGRSWISLSKQAVDFLYSAKCMGFLDDRNANLSQNKRCQLLSNYASQSLSVAFKKNRIVNK